MSEHTIENIKVDGIEIPFHYFQNPMFHEDWHEAEELGLVYIRYNHHGPDYWDDELLLVPKEHEVVKSHLKHTEW